MYVLALKYCRRQLYRVPGNLIKYACWQTVSKISEEYGKFCPTGASILVVDYICATESSGWATLVVQVNPMILTMETPVLLDAQSAFPFSTTSPWLLTTPKVMAWTCEFGCRDVGTDKYGMAAKKVDVLAYSTYLLVPNHTHVISLSF